MAISAVLSRSINFHRRAVLGAAGAVYARFSKEAYKGLTSKEKDGLLKLIRSSEKLTADLKDHAVLVEDFYITFGSELTKRTILARREILKRIANAEDVSDEDMAILKGKRVYANKRGPYKKGTQTHFEMPQNLLEAIRRFAG